jgi:hypothetical protein
MRRFLAAVGRAIVEGFATQNGWMWAYGCGPMAPQYWPRADAFQPSGLCERLDDRP